MNILFDLSLVAKTDPLSNGGEYGLSPHTPINCVIKQAYLSENEQDIIIEFANSTDTNISSIVYLPIYTKDGSQNKRTLFILNDLQFLLGIQGLQTTQGQISFYDKEIKAKGTKFGKVYQALVGKEIGLILLQESYYSPKYQKIKTKDTIHALFKSDTKQTPNQLKDGKHGEVAFLLKIAEYTQSLAEQSLQSAKEYQSRSTDYTPPSFGQSFGQSEQASQSQLGQGQGLNQETDIPF